MKIRTGFVSNSSSSSFVLIIKTDAYKEARKHTNAFTREVLDNMEPTRVTNLGSDITVLTTDMGGGGDPRLCMYDYDAERPPSKDDEDTEMDPFEAIDLFIETLPEDSYFQHTGYN